MINNFLKVNMETKRLMNTNVVENYSKLKLSLFVLPLFLLLSIVLFLINVDALSVNGYVEIQKECFIFLNSEFSQFPNLIYNLTQIGDALIFLSLISVFIVYAPKIWESLITASLVSAVFSRILKDIFSIPRPAEVFDNSIFVIIGRRLPGFSSLPSGHSITVFTGLTVLLFAFMPKKWVDKILWCFFILVLGYSIAFTRVGVGAHHPLDVISGSIIGYISALLGIFISRKYKIWAWINNIKSYPFFILLFSICCFVLIHKIYKENLVIFYLALTSLIVSLYKIIYVYIKK
jgi:membrane-associated phospholipid phosphatase